jgi:ATP/maltotriose-dependent transcriptional regulator MalT/DNA-binding SARP family transcriptional activator
MPKATPRLSKISRPQLPDVVSRKRLHALLDKGRERSIIWLTGPPGSGKTTLVAHYVETFTQDAIWYQMDPGDTDIATCFYYMSQAIVARSGDAVPALPTFTPQYLSDLAVFSRSYFRALYGCLDAPFAIVFDNYHDVAVQSRLHDVMQSALDEIPQGGCVIFISRTEPPPFAARFIANSQLEHFSWDDLRLTREESDAIVELRGHDLEETGKQRLYERTQGWAAGLLLMLEAMRREGPLMDIPESFTPNVVFDYLAGEIFREFDERDKDFLLRTATLPQITAQMAAELTGQDDAEARLASFNRHAYLISANHASGEIVYQYHPLLRDFLLNQAAQTLSRDERHVLQNRAADLLEQAGQIEDAIRFRIENREWRELGQLLREHAATMLEQGRGETLEQWLEELPGEQLNGDPWLLYWLAACKSVSTLRESRRLYEQVYQMFQSADQPDERGLFKACAGVLDTLLFDLDDLTLLDPWISEVERLAEIYPDLHTREHGVQITYNMYLALAFRQPSHPDIETWGERTYTLLQSPIDAAQKVRAAINLASGIVWTGRFGKAAEIVEMVRNLTSAPDVSPVAVTTLRYIESMHYMLSGEHGPCMEAVADSLEISHATGVHIWKNSILLNGVISSLGASDIDKAEELLAQLDMQAVAARRFDSCFHNFCLAWMAMLKNDVLEAYRHQRIALRLATEVGMPFFEVLFQLGLAQILFACGDERKGANALRQVRRNAGSIDNHSLEFLSFLIYAHIALTHGRKASGLRTLKYALGVGREHNFIHTLWWQPRDMATLAVAALENDIEVDYVRQLVIRRKLIPAEPPWHVDNWPWQFRVRSLGRFSLHDEANARQSSSRGRPIELLKVAIALGGREVAVERVTDALWPNVDADYAHRSFNTTLHRLRKTLRDDQAIVFRDGKLTLCDNFFWIDIWAFERALADLAKLLGDATPFIDHDLLMSVARRALALYQGPFLGNEDSPWTITAREQWKHRFVRFVNEITAYLQESQRSDEALAFLHSALDADELAEGVYRQLMLFYQQLERKAEAIEVYNRCRKALAANLDVDPSPETQELYQALLASE